MSIYLSGSAVYLADTWLLPSVTRLWKCAAVITSKSRVYGAASALDRYIIQMSFYR